MVSRFVAKIIVMAVALLCLSGMPSTGKAPAAVVSAAAHAPSALPVVGHVHGPQPFITLFCQFPDLYPTYGLFEYYEGLLGAAEPGLAHYWAEVSYGQISLDGSRITGWYPMPQPSDAYPLRQIDQALLDRLATDCMAAADADVDYPDYFGINLVFNFCMETAYGGRRRLAFDGREKIYGVTWLCTGKYGWQATVAHEMGHTFRLAHSSDHSGELYSNPWDVMSTCGYCRVDPRYGVIAQHPIAYQKDQLGWIPPELKYMAQPGSTAHITLERLAQPQTNDYLMAVVPFTDSSDRYYTVEARRRVGYDRNLPADGVVIHRIDPHSCPAAVVLAHETPGGVLIRSAWRPGDVFKDAEQGVRVEVARATETGYVVEIRMD
jgi:M6 family metalloprotease-like protein